MPKITSTGKQFVVTIPKDLIEIIRWDKSTKVIISKYPSKNFLFVEKTLKKSKEKNG